MGALQMCIDDDDDDVYITKHYCINSKTTKQDSARNKSVSTTETNELHKHTTLRVLRKNSLKGAVHQPKKLL